jgi:hypothetical protein
MQKLEQKLNDIAQQIKKGVTPENVSVREIPDWLGASRRGSNVNWRMRTAKVRGVSHPGKSSVFCCGSSNNFFGR